LERWSSQLLAHAYQAVQDRIVAVANPASRFYWLYLATAFVLAVVGYLYYCRQSAQRPGVRRFFGTVFDKRVYLHPSALLDYQLYFVNHIVALPTWLLAGLSTTSIAMLWLGLLNDTFGPVGFAVSSMWGITLLVALVSDFGSFLNHYVHHRVPVLWEFHKVHHTAEVLTPFTFFRSHPLYNVFAQLTKIVLVGTLQGIALYLITDGMNFVHLLGVNFVYTLFHVLGSNLRHTHLWVSFGPVLEHILISPAQHQVHHSVAARHRDKNMGEVFAFWDWLFGTLYVPRERETLVYGVEEGAPQEHPNLWAAYWVPFRNVARMLRVRRRAA
jgi:sterol desaturase/sphingolipid hydroxylase (fatty acid hydroxylase superfamily)